VIFAVLLFNVCAQAAVVKTEIVGIIEGIIIVGFAGGYVLVV
jgi:hypothetical protein